MELNYTEKNVTKGEERKNTSLSEAHTGKKIPYGLSLLSTWILRIFLN